ncbi:hypothetical protein [Mycolicibacterium celeriflavum]|uniref:hypothetical protein n=1 Tax=Mycolicibacterium celeriflavum TaxID=1249101 RepID=UPI003CFBA0EB
MAIDEQPTPDEPTTDMVPVPQAEFGPGQDLAISVTNEGMLVAGRPDVVDRYINKIKEAAGQLVDVANVSKGALGNAAAVAVGAVSTFAQHGQFVQLSAKSMEAIRAGNLMAGDPGFYRMTTVDNAGQFLQQLQWRPVSLGPTEMLSVQMIAAQMALKMAIAEVNESISRVEGKVESVLKLVEANRIGDVKGQYATVERMVRNLDNSGALPATDWQSIASLGPDLIVTVERLRAHAVRTLDDFDASKPVQERAEILRRAVEENRLGETLNLLVVAEESLNKWQRLRLARVQDVEPEHREQVVADAFDLLATQVAEDGKLYGRAAEVLETYRRTNRIDGFRYWSVRDVAKHGKQLQDDLDAFARARRHQLAQWQDLSTPTVRDAAGHVLAVAGGYAGRALNAAGERITSVTGLWSEEGDAKDKEAVRRTKRLPRFRRGDRES